MADRSGSLVRWARAACVVVAWVFVACLLVQVFLAGLGVFSNPADFITHREFGYRFGWLSLVAPIVALKLAIDARAFSGPPLGTLGRASIVERVH